MSEDKSPNPASDPAPASGEFWYCSHCSKMILPPGTCGMVAGDGEHYCSHCAPFEITPSCATPIDSPFGHKLVWRSRPKAPPPPPVLTNTSRKFWIGGAAGILTGALVAAFCFNFTGAKKPDEARPAAEPRTESRAVVEKKVEPAAKAQLIAVAARESESEEHRARIEPPKAGSIAALRSGEGELAKNTYDAAKTKSAETRPRQNAVELAPLQEGDGKPPLQTAAGKPPLQEAAANPRAAEFEMEFAAAAELVAREKFSDAQAQLDAIAKENANAAWWPEIRDRLVQARMDLRTKFEALDTDASAAAQHAKAASSAAALNEIEGAWKPRLACGEMTAQPAKRVLDAVRLARERLGKNETEKHCAAFAGSLENLERRTKSPLPKHELDAALSSLQELKTKLVADPKCAELYAERWAKVNFDLGCESNVERTILKVQPAGGAQTELLYDFKNSDQATAWKFERGGGSGDARVEFDAKALVLQVSGEQHADARAGKSAPSAQIPFYMAGEAWTLEADTHILNAKARDKKDLDPCYGILVTDGGKNSVHFSARETRKGELALSARLSDEHEAAAKLSGKQEDRVHLRIVCNANMAAFSAGINGKTDTVGRARLNFEPKFIGLYVETFDKDEDARVAFENVKLTGTLDKDKIKAAVGSRRNGEIEAQRTELIKASKSAK
ncbi:MAG TPA: hypothetical protein VKX17_15675 [Planctomycetota bacterium]|nr:hypothetical protein [Planctomycetota bacterium]